MPQSITELSQGFAEVAFVVLLEVPAGNFPRREAYVVACSIPEAAEAKVRELYDDELISVSAVVVLPFGVVKALKLSSGEVLPWQ
jgi:hypothetical protein